MGGHKTIKWHFLSTFRVRERKDEYTSINVNLKTKTAEGILVILVLKMQDLKWNEAKTNIWEEKSNGCMKVYRWKEEMQTGCKKQLYIFYSAWIICEVSAAEEARNKRLFCAQTSGDGHTSNTSVFDGAAVLASRLNKWEFCNWNKLELMRQKRCGPFVLIINQRHCVRVCAHVLAYITHWFNSCSCF